MCYKGLHRNADRLLCTIHSQTVALANIMSVSGSGFPSNGTLTYSTRNRMQTTNNKIMSVCLKTYSLQLSGRHKRFQNDFLASLPKIDLRNFYYVSVFVSYHQLLNAWTKKIIINYVALVHERTIPTDRLPLVGEVSANFCGGQRNEF
jgi:hypothetical protein